jgi:hypothetical protein
VISARGEDTVSSSTGDIDQSNVVARGDRDVGGNQCGEFSDELGSGDAQHRSVKPTSVTIEAISWGVIWEPVKPGKTWVRDVTPGEDLHQART